MNERNTLCSNHQIVDIANGQVQSHIHSDPCVLLGSTSTFPSSNINPGLHPPGSMSNFDLHHLTEHPGRPAFYGMTQYSQQPNHPATNLELGIPTPSNFFNGQINPPSGARVFPVPLSHGIVDHLPSSSNYRSNAVPFCEHGWSNIFADGARGLCKRKNAEGIPGTVQYFGSCAGSSSSSATPMTGCHFDYAAAAMDASPALPEYRTNGAPPVMEVGSGVSARHRPTPVGLHMDSSMLHNYNYLVQGGYGSQSFQPSSCPWVEQPSINNSGGFAWNGTPILPYFQGNNVHGGSPEMSNSAPGYIDASSSHSSANFMHLPPILQQHHNLQPSQNVPRVGGYGVACYPPYVAGPSRVPTNDGMQHDAAHVSQESAESVGRPTGIRIYRSHGRNPLPDSASRRRELPRLRTLQADRVALLEFPSFYEVDYEMENFVDHHRDMRLDIDDMSYEELLALSERIGTVSTGLSEEDITYHLKTRLYRPSTAAINLEELPCTDHNNDSCIVCQDDYEDNDKLGMLECGHDYHVDCLKKWLLVKNICPICKSSALTVDCKGQ